MILCISSWWWCRWRIWWWLSSSFEGGKCCERATVENMPLVVCGETTFLRLQEILCPKLRRHHHSQSSPLLFLGLCQAIMREIYPIVSSYLSVITFSPWLSFGFIVFEATCLTIFLRLRDDNMGCRLFKHKMTIFYDLRESFWRNTIWIHKDKESDESRATCLSSLYMELWM